MQRSIQRELVAFQEYLQKEGYSLERASKAAFSKGRHKFSHLIFVKMIEVVVDFVYNDATDTQYWKGHTVLGVDGSTVEVPNDKKVIEEWGVFITRTDGKKTCMARTSTIYDVLNHITLSGSIDGIKTSENAQFKTMFRELDSPKKSLYVFDRLYASTIGFLELKNKGVDFCFRMKNDWWKVVKTFYDSEETSKKCTLRLQKKDWEEAASLGIKEKEIQVRLVKVTLDTGEVEILLTSLLDDQKYTDADLKELYGLRWGIETFYNQLKSKANLENFSGKSIRAIKQDFYAKLLILNLSAVVVRPVEKLLEEKPKKKWIHKVNISDALGYMKTKIIDLLFLGKIESTLINLYELFKENTIPIRPNRKFKRPKLPKIKRNMCYKSV
jgi:IS4 transposase